MLQVINENPVSEEHVAWLTEKSLSSADAIVLHEVVRAFYRHPDAPEHALIPVIELRSIGEERRVAPEAAAWILLEAAQQAVCNERGVVKISGGQQMKNAQEAAQMEGSKESRTCETCQHWTRRLTIGESGFGRCPKNAPPIKEYKDAPATGGFNTTSRLHSCENWLKKTA